MYKGYYAPGWGLRWGYCGHRGHMPPPLFSKMGDEHLSSPFLAKIEKELNF